ncbi:hypothetical protein [Alkalicoccus daliensis]|uniref:Uncharacterized protein n=1 Tax=Alkalicoccus daliensis TaxID=745820 RepID=A0A1H0CY85_9BACI|nr:hypothetical protein [Alkalicoccus daliensis]SDN62857.1 hypothetical protein SAMN04488053_102275 [Alkalicoccus daliensis]
MTVNLAAQTAFFPEEDTRDDYRYYISKFLKHVYFAQLLYKRYVTNISPSDDVKFKTNFDEESMKTINSYLAELRKLELLSMDAPSVEDFAELKFFLEKLYFELTEYGYLEFIYQNNYLLTSQQLQERLSVSRATLSRMVANGMETADTTQHKKYPAHNAYFFQSSLGASRVLALKAQFDSRNLTKARLIEELVQEIENFEEEYGGKFENIFADILNEKIDIYDLEEPEDFKDWKDALEELKDLDD